MVLVSTPDIGILDDLSLLVLMHRKEMYIFEVPLLATDVVMYLHFFTVQPHQRQNTTICINTTSNSVTNNNCVGELSSQNAILQCDPVIVNWQVKYPIPQESQRANFYRNNLKI